MSVNHVPDASSGDDATQFQRVRQPSLVERVADDLRGAIMDGRLGPGAKVSDARIAADMGLSRSPVREAIRRLAAQGLVREEPRRGAFVTSLSRTDVHAIYECRRALESFAAGRLAADSHDRASDELAKICAEMRHVAARGDRLEAALIDQAFHRRMCELVDNAWLTRLYAVIGDQMHLILAVNNQAHPPTNADEMAAIHEPIVDAIRSGDPKGAIDAVMMHLDTAEDLFMTEAAGLIEEE